MKKKVTMMLVSATLIHQLSFAGTNLTQDRFFAVNNMVPLYVASGTSTRLPYVFRAVITGLTPNATYRYYTQVATSTDFGGANSGAGNPLFISPDGNTWNYATSVSLSTLGQYGEFTTTAGGVYTGWFGFVHTGNTRFTAGNTLYPTITLNNGSGGSSVVDRWALDLGISVLQFSTSPGANNGTGIRGNSLATDKEIVALYDNESGTGRPLAIAPIEDLNVSFASMVTYYANNVDGISGAWGTIIPNTLPTGVRRIARYSRSTGASGAYNTDADGVWPSGADTVSPSGGTTPIIITTGDAPLPEPGAIVLGGLMLLAALRRR